MYTGRTLFSQVMDFVPWTSFHRIFDKIEAGNQTTPGKPYPNTTEAGFMRSTTTPAASGSLSDILPFRRPTGR